MLFFFINLPFSHRFVTKQTNRILSNLDLPIHIQSIRTILPTTVNLQGVEIFHFDGDAIIYAGELQVGYSLPSLLFKKVKLQKVYMDSARITLSMNNCTCRYNIAEAFSPDLKPKEEVSEKEKNSWEISIRNGALSNVNFQMFDTLTGLKIFQEIAVLKMKNFKLSLLNKTIFLSSVDLIGAEGGVKITPRPLRPKRENESPWNFGLRKITLNDLSFTYDHGGDSLLLNLILGEGLIRVNHMDIHKKEIDIDKISMREAHTTILTGNPSNDSKSSQNHSSGSFPWDLITEKLDLKNVTIMLGNYCALIPYAPVSEISITDLDMSLSDIKFNNIT